MSYDKTNRGQIWKNERKEKDTHPDFKGDANIDGVEYWLSAWKRKPDANPKAPALSFTFKLKDERDSPDNARPKPAPMGDSFNDDIPFD